MKLIATFSILLSACSASHAVITPYFERSQWSSEAGTLTFFEDFDEFTSDVPFTNAPLELNGFSVLETGLSPSELKIDAFPFSSNGVFGINGTSYLKATTDFDRLMEIEFHFVEPVTAFGGDFANVNADAERLVIDLIAENGQVLESTLPPRVNDTFVGFIANGESVASLRLYSQQSISNRVARFGMDNIGGF